MEARRLQTLSPSLRQRFAAGRVWAAHQAPYLASALLALDPVVVQVDPGEQVDLSAFPVDRRWHVYLVAEVLEKTEVSEIGFWLLHQVGHLLRSHAPRFPERALHELRDPGAGRTPAQRRWNSATNAEIDDDLSTEDLRVPGRAVTPTALGLPNDQTAEMYWDRLQLSDGDPAEDGGDIAYDCGSGCDGQPRAWDCGWPGLSAAAVRRCQRESARRIRDHVRERGGRAGA